MGIKHEIRRILWRTGFDISRVTPESHHHARIRQLLRAYEVQLVLDVGANVGQFARELRAEVGYKRQIVSFEPMKAAFSILQERASRDEKWDARHFALGDMDGQSEINIAGNSFSSSLLSMLPAHLNSAPESAYVNKETIEVKRLDSVFDQVVGGARNIYLKIDTQGFEGRVLRGAEQALDRISTVQMEMALVPLYESEMLFPELVALMASKGYVMVALLPGFSDAGTGQMLQVDGIFHRFTDGTPLHSRT